MKNNNQADQPDSGVNVGRRLRELRAERGISIRALAEQSGLNVNTLSLIENGKTSPSVSTLQQVASALKVPITTFFEVPTSPQVIVFTKANNRQSTAFSHGTLADLGAGFTHSEFEPFLVILEPGADSGDTSIVHTGLEFVFCLEGQLVYDIDGQTFELSPGDSLLFEAHLAHRWHNPGQYSSHSLLLLCPSDNRDNPNERHFSTGK